MPRLSSLQHTCLTQIGKAASASDAALDMWQPEIDAMLPHLRGALVEAMRQPVRHAPDALMALRLGRLVPEHRKTVWGLVHPARALCETPFADLLETPGALQFWLLELCADTFAANGSASVLVLNRRLKLVDDILKEGGFRAEQLGGNPSALRSVLGQLMHRFDRRGVDRIAPRTSLPPRGLQYDLGPAWPTLFPPVDRPGPSGGCVLGGPNLPRVSPMPQSPQVIGPRGVSPWAMGYITDLA